ncbi:uncharacterized protein LAJ45_00621 [Morchella importuna]|uniref:uncharacterized protein n=1 Tax=Morchella importuna TaxID=1174673 RepID=UPI001E8E7C56|nr:uncharacterized protein LAJ45_00621 [Morchella importuna]KAH8155611.1 hypothetical protein LAJ45_00621 [Morchella importuna]
MDYENESRGYDEDREQYQRDERSVSPRGRRGDSAPRRDRVRSASPGVGANAPFHQSQDLMTAVLLTQRQTRLNAVVTVAEMVAHQLMVPPTLYGEVEKCQIMLDPHTKESRGFGFVKMATLEQADGAKEGLQGEVFEGRTLSIEKARRSRPRTPTPGKYFGPPKRDDFRRGPPPPRYDDRGGGRYPPRGGRYDEYDRGYSSRYDDRDGRGGDRYYRSREPRDDYPPPRGVDRYASSRGDDRYTREDRRAPREPGYTSYAEREPGYSRTAAAEPAVPPAGSESGGRGGYGGYRDDPRDDRSYRR